MKKRQFFRKVLLENNQKVEVYTVASRKPVQCGLVNLSAGGVALKLSQDSVASMNLRRGDIVFVNLQEMGISSSGISAKVMRISAREDLVELGISFLSSSSQFKGEVESVIGWSQLKSSLKKPRSGAAQIYNGEEQTSDIPKWLETLLRSLGRNSGQYMQLESPLKPKSHLVEWIEGSLDREQLGISLTQSL